MRLTTLATLADTPGFIIAFEQEMSTGKHLTRLAAYETLEAKRVKHIGARKFKNYASFRVARRIHLSKPQTT